MKKMDSNQPQNSRGSMIWHPGSKVPMAPRRMTETTKPTAPSVSVLNRSTGKLTMVGQHVGVIRSLPMPKRRPSNHSHPKGSMVGYNEQDLQGRPRRKGR